MDTVNHEHQTTRQRTIRSWIESHCPPAELPPALWKVSAIEPGRYFVWRSGGPGIRVTGSHTVEPIATGSRATLFVTYEGLLGGIFARMTHELTQRYIEYEARGLKARSENPGYHHSGFI
jgi:hypothetical protein